MAMSHPLYTLDVFTNQKYTGNQLAVIRHAGDIDDTTMQAIAREMNYSETTFIKSDEPREGGYDVRIFTPEAELPFAGHPTLGTAFVIQQEIVQEKVNRVTLNLPVGPIPVEIKYQDNRPETLWMTQNPPEFGEVLDTRKLAKVLNLSTDAFDERFPIQAVSTGFPALIVPLKSLEFVKQAQVDRPAYFKLVESIEPKVILVFSQETYEAGKDLNVRVFVDYFGIPEDPATGSANGCLAAWLAEHQYFGSREVNVSVEQGHEIKRPANLLLSARDLEGILSVRVGGSVVLVSRGELL